MPNKSVNALAAPSHRGGGPSPLRVSLVIPAHNEEAFIRACVEAACSQTVPFYEIIVVDNNSSDRTAKIARSFPGVTVIEERRQGKVYARTTGIDAAKGDIIARIDADTVVPEEWNERVLQIFKDKTIAAMSGRAEYYDLACPRLASGVEHFFRKHLAYELRETMFLQGANMAIRRHAWRAVRRNLCARNRHIHEDFDIGIHLQQQGMRVTYEDGLVAGLSARCIDVSFRFFVGYVRMNTQTYAAHQVAHYRRMYPTIAIALLLFFPGRLLFRGRHPQTGKFSPAWLFSPKTASARAQAAGSIYLS